MLLCLELTRQRPSLELAAASDPRLQPPNWSSRCRHRMRVREPETRLCNYRDGKPIGMTLHGVSSHAVRSLCLSPPAGQFHRHRGAASGQNNNCIGHSGRSGGNTHIPPGRGCHVCANPPTLCLSPPAGQFHAHCGAASGQNNNHHGSLWLVWQQRPHPSGTWSRDTQERSEAR